MAKIIITLWIIIFSISCVYPRSGHMMDWYLTPFGYGGIMTLIILLVLIGIIIYFVVNRKRLTIKDESDSPLEILKRRYAKGEISKDEFDKMKKDIE